MECQLYLVNFLYNKSKMADSYCLLPVLYANVFLKEFILTEYNLISYFLQNISNYSCSTVNLN